jgi:predicted DNA-binding transcriptional regulator AlpA
MEKLILNMAEVADILGVSERMIYKYRCGHSLNPILEGLPEPIVMRPMRWHRQDIVDWLETKRTFSKPDVVEAGLATSMPTSNLPTPRRGRGRPRKTAQA